eukprot:g15211.t1
MKRKRGRAADGGSVRPDVARKKARLGCENSNSGAEASAEKLESNRSTGDKDTGDTSGGDRSSGDARRGHAGATGGDMDRPRLASPSASMSSEGNYVTGAEFASCDDVSGREVNGSENDNEMGEGDGEDNARGSGGPGNCDGVEKPGAVNGEAGDTAAAPMAGLVEDQRSAKGARTDVHAGLQGDSQPSGKAVSSGDRCGYLGTSLSGSGAEKGSSGG